MTVRIKLVCLVWLCWNKGWVRDILGGRRRTTHKMNGIMCNSKYGRGRNASFQLSFLKPILSWMCICIAFILLKTNVFEIRFMVSMIQCFWNCFDRLFTGQAFFLAFFYDRKISQLMQTLCELIFQKTTMKYSFQLGPSTLIFHSVTFFWAS